MNAKKEDEIEIAAWIDSVLCDFFVKMLVIHRHGIRWIYLVGCDLQLLQIVSDLGSANVGSNKRK